MQDSKVYVQKRGQVYTVPIDPNTGVPIKITSVTSELPGFPFTFTSEHDLKKAFPNKELVYLEDKPVEAARPLVIGEDIKRKAAEYMKQHRVPEPSKPQLVATAADTGLVLQNTVSSKQKAEEFLKRLQTALQYASKKHEKKLKDQVEIIEELLREVF